MFNPGGLFRGDRVARVRFGRGVVGNTTYGFWAVCVASVGIAWAFADNPGYGVILIGGIVGTYLIFLIGTWSFAGKHPDLAMLGDSEWLRYVEHQAAIKGLAQLPASPLITDPEADTELPPPSKTDGP